MEGSICIETNLDGIGLFHMIVIQEVGDNE